MNIMKVIPPKFRGFRGGSKRPNKYQQRCHICGSDNHFMSRCPENVVPAMETKGMISGSVVPSESIMCDWEGDTLMNTLRHLL